MKKNGYTILEMLVVIGILGIFTITLLATTSYAYKDNTTEHYNEVTKMIEHRAKSYGATLNNLKEEGNLVITLNDMIEAGFYEADEDGNVVDPRNSKANLNGLKIKLTYTENGEINAEVLNDN